MRSVVNRNVVMQRIPVDGVIYNRKLAKNSHKNLASHLTDTQLYRHVVIASVVARELQSTEDSGMQVHTKPLTIIDCILQYEVYYAKQPRIWKHIL
jgi:hypothetical protein